MEVDNSDIDTCHLHAALLELHAGNVYQQYDSLLYIACGVAAGDKNALDRLKNMITHGKKLVVEHPLYKPHSNHA